MNPKKREVKKRVICIDISAGTFEQQMETIIDYAENKRSSYVCVVNVHMLVEAYKNPDFATIVNEADLAVPDGMPVAKSIGYLHGIPQERIAGVEIIEYLLKESSKRGIKIGFYGGTQEIQNETKKYIENHHPQAKITQYKPHPFRELSIEEEQQLAGEFNDSGTQILFVATGCPRQERWMAVQKGNINACMIGIGGALTVVTGMKKNAPEWMRKNSLEWLFRLMLEPRRLFKRYAVTNTTFLWLLGKEILFRRKRFQN